MNDTVLRCSSLSKSYGGVVAVRDLSLEVSKGELLVVLGPSGCGKTTTLRLLAGFEIPDSGTIELSERTVADPRTFVPPERRKIGMVFQEYALFPHLTLEKNIGYGLPSMRRAGFSKNPNRQMEQLRLSVRVSEVLGLVGITHLSKRMPHELSGGEQQRAALARALAPRPLVLLMDEPFSNLDAKLREQVREDVKRILSLTKVTTLLVTHNQEEALTMADRVAVMNQGRLEQVDTPQTVYQRPATTFVARFVGTAGFLAATFSDGRLHTAAGPVERKLPPRYSNDLEVMARPEDLTFEPSEDGQGRLISSAYYGAYTLYTIIMDSGEIVYCMKPTLEFYPEGTSVQVRLTTERELPCYHRGRLV